MSEKIHIKELLKAVEVEWKPLNEVCEFKNGFAFKSNLFKDSGLPIIRITNIDGKNVDLSDVKYFNPTDYKENIDNYQVIKNDILIAMSGATTGKIGFYNYDKTAYLNQRVGKFIPNDKKLNNRYLYHLLLSIVEEIYIIAGGGAQPNLSSNILMSKIQIPIPYPNNVDKSLEVQNEIVLILDNFTELTTELTAELTAELCARKKQYSYYRDKLLTFADGKVEFKTLGEVIQPTNNIRWRDTDEIYRYIDLTSVSRENNSIIETSEISAKNAPNRAQKIVLKNDVIFATTRPTQQRFCLITDEYSGEIASTGYCVLRAKTDEISPKWIFYHISSTNFKNYVEENQSGSAYPAISDSKVKEYQIPIPYANNPKKSLEEQERIVSILDKFDTLTNSISEGLPKEIKLREQQYEYYRDLLLTFPKDKEVE